MRLLVGVIIPIVLGYMLFSEVFKVITEGYGGYPTWLVGIFGWGMAIGLAVVGFLLSRLAWKNEEKFEENE